MMELVLTVCAIAQPALCRDQRVLLDSDIEPWQCVISAPPYIAKWTTEHPEWTVTGWTCQYPKKEKVV